MLLGIIQPISRRYFEAKGSICQMGSENTSLMAKTKRANFRMINVSGFKTDLLELQSRNPAVHVLFIPGNPGVVSFYVEFLESLFELFGGAASVTAIGHISHTEKNWESGRLFSLQEQIEHKVSFVEHTLQDEAPIVLVGHSIGSHISLEVFKRCPQKVTYCICLYPFLTLNAVSNKQARIKRLAASATLSVVLSSVGAFLGMFPAHISRFLAKIVLGNSFSSSAVDVLSTHVLKYHTLRNVLFMAKTEFEKLPEELDWDFIGGNKSKIAYLFGLNDHWGPMHLYDEIRENVPGATLTVECEGHTHAFCCTEAGSIWAAQHVFSTIKKHLQNLVSSNS